MYKDLYIRYSYCYSMRRGSSDDMHQDCPIRESADNTRIFPVYTEKIRGFSWSTVWCIHTISVFHIKRHGAFFLKPTTTLADFYLQHASNTKRVVLLVRAVYSLLKGL